MEDRSDLTSQVEASVAYRPVFTSLSCFNAASTFDIQLKGNGNMYATEDFTRPVEPASKSHVSDSYLRSVQWVLIPSVSTYDRGIPAIIVSPHEAQQLMSRLHAGSAAALHTFKPYWSTGWPALNQLIFFHFPPAKIACRLSPDSMAQLNIFARSPCFYTFQEYIDTCVFLRLAHRDSKDGIVIANDGFMMSIEQDPSTVAERPHRSPVAFAQALLYTRVHHRAS
jgi:hypothetical protein